MIIATAGHVDHGKSTLVRALTGTDPDRLAEERRRGLSIELGFVWTDLGPYRVSFVDVPGHADFIRTMIAGVAAAPVAILVIDGREGWRAQTHEHLLILDLVGVEHLLVVVTKASTVQEAELAQTLARTAEYLAPTPFAHSRVIVCDAVAGTGMAHVRAALTELVTARSGSALSGSGLVGPAGESSGPGIGHGRPRLWIDRSFTMVGAGTVVTGSLTGGSLHRDDRLFLVGRVRSRRVRVRRLESSGEAHDALPPGVRAAVNLAEVGHRSIQRGDVLVEADRWHLTRTIDASLRIAHRLGHEVTRRGAYTIHIGTVTQSVRLRLLHAERLAPGATGRVRIHLAHDVPLLPGDRYILMETGRAEVVGGGEVLDVDPVLRAGRADPDRSVDRVVAERGWIDVDHLERLTGERRRPDAGSWVVHPPLLAESETALVARVATAGANGLAVSTLDGQEQALVERLVRRDRLVVREGMVLTAGSRDGDVRHPVLDALRAQPLRPPDPRKMGVRTEELMTWQRRGLVVSIDGIAFPAEAPRIAADRLHNLLRARPEGITVGEVGTVLDTSRKYAVPLLGLLDRTGVTRRVGDRRVAGPRLGRGG